jgi:hypothetical protein
VAEFHIAVFFFTAVPAREAGAHEKVAIIAIRDNLIELFLADWCMGCAVQQAMLTGFAEAEVAVRILDKELAKEVGSGRFLGGEIADSMLSTVLLNGEAEDFWRGIVTQKMVEQSASSGQKRWRELLEAAYDIGEREFEDITYR